MFSEIYLRNLFTDYCLIMCCVTSMFHTNADIMCMLGLRIQQCIYSVHKLLQLVDNKCRYPNCNELCLKKVKPFGCCLVISGRCSAVHAFLWESLDTVVNQNNIKMYTDNLQLSSVVGLFGNHYHKVQMFSNFYNLQIPCSTVFYAHQQHYTCLAANALYLKEQVYGYVPVAVCISTFP